MRLDELLRAIPPATQVKLPRSLQGFKVARRSWLVQLYYADPLVHYEVVTLGAKRGQLEIGLHFESRNSAANEQLLNGFMQHLFEIKAELGDSFAAITKSLFATPGITTSVPRIVSVKAIRAAASAVMPDVLLFSAIPARVRNSVWVMPGQKTVTVTPVLASSLRIAAENDNRNALQAL